MGLISEYIARGLGGIDLENELMRLIGEYNRKQGTFLIVYAGAISKQVPAVALSMDDYFTAFDILKNVSSKKLDFYVETPGGSGEAAEEIVRFIRTKFEDVNFVVAGEAKSAGTIMVLLGDEILMTDSGSLGPIDAQIKIGRSNQSAYDYIKWVEEKRDEAAKNGRLNPFDATMVAQISPGELNGVDNSLKFAQDLVVEWLPKYKFKNWKITETRKLKVTEKMKNDRAKEIVDKLIDHTKWRSHGRPIKITDLENSIGLKIIRIDEDKTLADIVYRIQTVIKLLFSTTNTFKIFATESEKIFATAVSAGIPPQIAPQQAEVVQMDIQCPKCSNLHKLYAKLASNPKIDDDLQEKGYKKFPDDSKLKCTCGFELDMTGMRNDIETKSGRKIV